MTRQEAVTLLRQFNEWRRSDVTTMMPNPREVGVAIDVVCDALDGDTTPPTAKAIEEAALRKDAERYRWLCENGDKDGGLFIGGGHVGTWGECGHYEYAYKDHADDAIDAAMAAKQQEARGEE